jgi:hypothetical protein
MEKLTNLLCIITIIKSKKMTNFAPVIYHVKKIVITANKHKFNYIKYEG